MMNLDLNTVFAFCGGMLGLFAFIGQIKSFFSSGEKKLGEDIVEIKEMIGDASAETRVQLTGITGKLTEHDRRIQSLEGEIKHMPDRDTAHRLELAMEKISGRLDTLDEKLKPIAATNERMNELLVEQARK